MTIERSPAPIRRPVRAQGPVIRASTDRKNEGRPMRRTLPCALTILITLGVPIGATPPNPIVSSLFVPIDGDLVEPGTTNICISPAKSRRHALPVSDRAFRGEFGGPRRVG